MDLGPLQDVSFAAVQVVKYNAHICFQDLNVAFIERCRFMSIPSRKRAAGVLTNNLLVGLVVSFLLVCQDVNNVCKGL